MGQHLQDRGVRKALQGDPCRLPSNFTYQTMRRVEEYIRVRERRQNRRLLWMAIASACLLLGGGCLTIYLYAGQELVELWDGAFSSLALWKELPWVYELFPLQVLLLLWGDHWLRRRYYKRH